MFMLVRRKYKLIILVCACLIIYWWFVVRLELKKGNNKTFDPIGLIKSKKELEIKEDGYDKYSFNILVSDRIGFSRNLPNTRHKNCAKKVSRYKARLKASVIICFYNEAWSTLLRTVYSVINRTPQDILKEIILINDQSTLDYVEYRLPIYLRDYLPQVKLYHTDSREGLIRARVKGAGHATGDVLVFLDSHCEVNKYWLEPLLASIQEHRKTVVCPVIDTISPHTFEYESSPLVRGGFNWGMHFTWEDIPPGLITDGSEPIKSPTMSGGLFAIDRKYFFQLGSYDESMDIWGAENLEISFRIWMCGGKLEIIPCSRVGHVFRDRRPYGNEGKGDTMSKNSVRLVEVWLDEYKKYFYDIRPDLQAIKVDVSSRKSLRERLNCKPFKWYLDAVYPELGIPMVREGVPFHAHPVKDSPTQEKGKLQNLYFNLCFDTIGDPLKKMSTIILRKCDKTMTRNVRHTWDNQLKVTNKLCLDVVLHTHTKNEARTMKCHNSRSGQEWKFKRSQQIYNPALGMCLAGNKKHLVITEICDDSSQAQKWHFMD